MAVAEIKLDGGSSHPQRARLLIVEDEEIVAEDLRETLSQFGYEVAAHASTGEQAVKLSLESRPDLVLMDIMLGQGMDGIHAAQHIRQHLDVPVLYLTAHADASTLSRAKASEPFGYLVKPFEERSLHTTVEIALLRHAAEQRLRFQRRWLAPILNRVSDAVLLVDETGHLTFMNQTAEVITGVTLPECLGARCDDFPRLIQQHTRRQVGNPISKSLHTGLAHHLPADTLLENNKSGSLRPVLGCAAAICDATGRAIGGVIVLREAGTGEDAEALAGWPNAVGSCRLADGLEAENRRVEFLLQAISHDLRSPLTVLRTYTGLLAQDFHKPLGPAGQKLIENLERSMKRMEEMIQGYLSLARSRSPNSLERKLVDMQALAHEVITEVQWLSERLTLRFECSDLPPVQGDRTMLRQVWINLISNAVKYSQSRLPARIAISGRCEAGYSVYSVADEGVGFDAHETARLFNPFHRLHRADGVPGLGLGLSVVKAIIEAHGGSITATGRVDHGATFEFRLPIIS